MYGLKVLQLHFTFKQEMQEQKHIVENKRKNHHNDTWGYAPSSESKRERQNRQSILE